ncbi:two-component system, NarL family, nitrate/nitrite sensor histidine kinase NarQ [Paenibacillus sp. UNC496MF]|uniref:sensor histidine kinase n=1 Tax=Paenibacillus sp. UNC496MF TaxID=1502753 RepID=UPI0008EE0FD0|nr:histidine kinase [Paenibacillus sp. UNC496MF]SFJ01867.1 two-component system, NarL family, nitrate/nitrite sensor histidine kinase NarQ [Paenibacillus sp. UNC496MF]
MTYKRLKWLILWTPTLTIALWEYLRHTLLLPYLSMDLGNALAPVIVMTVTATLLLRLFRMLEDTQDTLQRSKAAEAAFEEREQLARELHDGISQSLFLLSVKLDKLEHAKDPELAAETMGQLRRTVKHVYDDVRQSIAALRSEPSRTDVQWMRAVRDMAAELELGGLRVELDWQLADARLSGKEKVQLIAIVREAMQNARKHAGASRLRVQAAAGGEAAFRCTVADDGAGADPERLFAKGRYGVRMMQGRAAEMGWRFAVRPAGADDAWSGGRGTVVEVEKEG